MRLKHGTCVKEKTRGFAAAAILASGLALGCQAKKAEQAGMVQCDDRIAETEAGREVIQKINGLVASKSESFTRGISAAGSSTMEINISLEVENGYVKATDAVAKCGKFRCVSRDVDELKRIRFEQPKLNTDGRCKWNIETVVMKPQS